MPHIAFTVFVITSVKCPLKSQWLSVFLSLALPILPSQFLSFAKKCHVSHCQCVISLGFSTSCFPMTLQGRFLSQFLSGSFSNSLYTGNG